MLGTGNGLLLGGTKNYKNDVARQFILLPIVFLTSAPGRGRRFMAHSHFMDLKSCLPKSILSGGKRELSDIIAIAANINLRLSTGLTQELTNPFRVI